MRRPLVLSMLALTCLLVSCGDEDGPSTPGDGNPPPPPPDLVPDSLAVLEVNEIQVEMDRAGTLINARLATGSCYGIFLSGLWIGTEVGGEPRGNLTWVGDSPWSNYTSRVGEAWVGPYRVTIAHLRNEETDWPLEEGFPVNDSGEPVVYGDVMLWSALRPDIEAGQQSPILSSPLEHLEVGMSVFAVQGEGLDRMFFLRWDITNASEVSWSNVHVGLYSDTDLYPSDGIPSSNLTGYDTERGITYTYLGDRSLSEPQFVCGFAFLSTPAADAPSHKVTAHRPMMKNLHPDYGEDEFDRAEQILWALQGRTKSGEPMIDPTTNEATLYAFSGDPIAGQGWLDAPPRDVRGLLASGPFDLGPGATESVLAVWDLAYGPDLYRAIERLRADIDEARREGHRLTAGRRE